MVSDLEGGQNRREQARIARPMRVLESRSRRANGIVLRPKRAHKTRKTIIVLCDVANRAVAADARRKSVDDRHTPAAPSMLHGAWVLDRVAWSSDLPIYSTAAIPVGRSYTDSA